MYYSYQFFGVELTVKNERVSRLSQKLPVPLSGPWIQMAGSACTTPLGYIGNFWPQKLPPSLVKPWIQPDLLVIFWMKITKVYAILIITCTSHKFQYTFFCTIPWVSLERRRKRKLEAPVRKLVILYCKVYDLYDRHFTVKKMINFRK